MSQDINMCEISDEAKKLLKSFRMKKVEKSSAVILKVDMEKCMVVIDTELENVSLEELVESLPERSPRYICMIVRHEKEHGRVTYPLMCIFFSPDGVKTDQQMVYANTLNQVSACGGFTKVFKIRELDEINDEWLAEQLNFFR